MEVINNMLNKSLNICTIHYVKVTCTQYFCNMHLLTKMENSEPKLTPNSIVTVKVYTVSYLNVIIQSECEVQIS